MRGDRQILIGGAPVVFAIGVLDGPQLEVYRYIVVTQDLESGVCTVGVVIELTNADEMDETGRNFRIQGNLAATREQAISHALEQAGYPQLRGEEE
jgi:hypothetical protein